MGGYGFIRFSIPMFPLATIYFTPIIYTLSLLATIYASFTTLRQIDLKKVIAYSSISHLGFVTVGLYFKRYFFEILALILIESENHQIELLY